MSNTAETQMPWHRVYIERRELPPWPESIAAMWRGIAAIQRMQRGDPAYQRI